MEKLFQSYADMIYFLENTASNPELYEVFKKDLMDFFDFRAPSQANQLHPFFGVYMSGTRLVDTAFTRLLFASVVPQDDPYDKHFDNNRFRMLLTLQGIVFAKMSFLLRNLWGVNSQVTKSALKDLENALGWVSLRGIDVPEEDYTPKRILKFPSPYSKK